MRSRALLVSVFLNASLSCIGLVSASAQNDSTGTGLCAQPRRLPACRVGFLLGTSVLKPLGGIPLGGSPLDAHEHGAGVAIGVDMGILVNLSPTWAVGVQGFVLGFEDTRFGVMGRVRRWAGKDWAFDLDPGVTLAMDGTVAGLVEFPAFTGRIGVTWRDWIGIDLRVDQLRVAPVLVSGDGTSAGHGPVEIWRGWYIGAHTGGRSGLLGLGLLLVTAVAVIIGYSASY